MPRDPNRDNHRQQRRNDQKKPLSERNAQFAIKGKQERALAELYTSLTQQLVDVARNIQQTHEAMVDGRLTPVRATLQVERIAVQTISVGTLVDTYIYNLARFYGVPLPTGAKPEEANEAQSTSVDARIEQPANTSPSDTGERSDAADGPDTVGD